MSKTNEKNLLNNIQVNDKITKTTFNNIIKYSNNVIYVLDEKNDNSEYKFIVSGKMNNMRFSNNFEQIVLEFIKEQKEFNKNIGQDITDIKSRLDNIEQDIIDIKSCPTIQKELKNK